GEALLRQEPERVGKVGCFEGADRRADSGCQRRARRIADAVDGEDGGTIEARRKIRRSRMRQVMRHEMELLPQRPPKDPFGRTTHFGEPPQGSILPPRIRPPPRANGLSL